MPFLPRVLSVKTQTGVAYPRRDRRVRPPKPHIRRTTASETRERGHSGVGWYILLAIIVLSFALIRFRLRDMPLERDEGEYAYAGQLLLQGIPPYQLAYNMKLPGTYLAYAVIMALFGQTPSGIRIGLLLASTASTLLVFFVAKRLLDQTAAGVAAASYALLVTSPAVLGFAGHATHFVVLAALGGMLLLLRAMKDDRSIPLLASGVLFGLAFLMKQPGILFSIFAGLYLLTRARNRNVGPWRALKSLAIFAVGTATPFGLLCLWLWRAGVFHRFWFWTFTYARLYGSMVKLRDAPGVFWMEISSVVASAPLVWLSAAAGLISLFCSRRSVDRLFLVGFLLFSFFAVCPGFYFREHYFILLIPAVALLVGAGVSLTAQLLRDHSRLRSFRAVPMLVFLLAFGLTISHDWAFFFEMDPIAACRSVYGSNPFPEAIPVARYLKANTPAGASIAVIGSEPEIYFYAQRHSATGYIYTYPLMEDHRYAERMQEEMISEIEQARPEFVVFVNVPISWVRRPTSPSLIFDWASKYLTSQYELNGVADILDESHYVWGDDAKAYNPISPYRLQIFRRLPNPLASQY